MHSLKSFWDQLLPSAAPAAWILYGASSAALIALLLRSWSAVSHPGPMLWSLTCLVAVLVDPHLVDYDLTVLVLAGVLAAAPVPSLRWLIALLYPVLVMRSVIPLGHVNLSISVPLIGLCAFVLWRRLANGAHKRTADQAARQHRHSMLQPG
jgi:hypothetical protein